jgi:predicted dehydrogenase
MVARNGSLLRIGLLGYGYWGPNLGRVIQASQSCELAAVTDLSSARLAQAGIKHSGVQLTDRWSEVVSDRSIDAVVIATPVDSHFDLALAALSAGKHVFVEKPMTQTSAEAIRLIEESERRRLVLMVDHTFLFEPAVLAISKVISAGELGRVTSWKSERTNCGVVRKDVNVVWDLAVHDFSILDYVLAVAPSTISAVGTASGDGSLEHTASLTLQFQHCLTAHIHVDWLAPQKVRRISIQGEAGVLDYDDLNPMRKVTLTRSATSSAEPEGARVLETEAAEPLERAIQHFAECVASGGRPIVDGAAALRVVRLLEAADRSIHSMGRTVTLDREGANE